jgi:RNA polymerase sigma-70 factor (ECF subfamily)
LAALSSPLPNLAANAPRSEHRLLDSFNEQRPDLVRMLFFILGNYEDAQDVAQEVFLKCWRDRDGLASVQNLRAWIFRLGVNAARDLQRNVYRQRRRPLTGAATLADANVPCPVKLAKQHETEDRLRQALRVLRPEEKDIFLLRQTTLLTFEEIAELRHSPVGTIKTQMRAAITKLRRLLREK